eukprot:3706529-Prymnesium_polylepis.1
MAAPQRTRTTAPCVASDCCPGTKGYVCVDHPGPIDAVHPRPQTCAHTSHASQRSHSCTSRPSAGRQPIVSKPVVPAAAAGPRHRPAAPW